MESVYQWFADYWKLLTGTSAVVIVALVLDTLLNSARRSLIRKLFLRVSDAKQEYDRWAENLSGYLNKNLGSVLRYHVKRRFAADLPQELTAVQRAAMSDTDQELSFAEFYQLFDGGISNISIEDHLVTHRGVWRIGRSEDGPSVLLISANGGMGKTELLQWIYLRVARNWRNFTVALFGKKPPKIFLLRTSEFFDRDNSYRAFQLSEDRYRDAVLLFDGLGEPAPGAPLPPARLRRIVERYPQARSIVFTARTANLLPYWKELRRMAKEPRVRLRQYHLVPFDSKVEVEKYLRRRYGKGGRYREAQRVVADNPVFIRPLYLSYLPELLGTFYRVDTDKLTAPGLPERLRSYFARQEGEYFNESELTQWLNRRTEQRDQVVYSTTDRQTIEKAETRLTTWLDTYDLHLRKVWRVNLDISHSEEILDLLTQKAARREAMNRNRNNQQILLETCTRRALEIFENDGDYFQPVFSRRDSLLTELRNSGYGLFITAAPSPDNQYRYRFTHRSVYLYFLARAIWQDMRFLEKHLQRFDSNNPDHQEVLQQLSRKAKKSDKFRTRFPNVVQDDETDVLTIPFIDLSLSILLAFPTAAKLQTTIGDRIVCDLPLASKPSDVALFDFLSAAAEVEELNLSGGELKDEHLRMLRYFPSLKRLDLSENQIRSLEPIRYLGNLGWVKVSGNPLGELEANKMLYKGIVPRARFVVGRNAFPVRKLFYMDKRDWIELDLKTYSDYRGIPISYLIYRAFRPDFKKILEEYGISIDMGGRHRVTALMVAAMHRDARAVEELIELGGADVNVKGIFGHTALMCAAQNSDAAALRALLSAEGIDPNAKDNKGGTALMYAAQHNDAAALRALLSAEGIDPNAKTKEQEMTALMYAARYNDAAALRALLSAEEIDPNAKTKEQELTALMYAALHNDAAALRALLSAEGIDPNAKSKEQEQTALMYVAYYNDAAALRALLSAEGIDPNAKDNNNWTALMIAAQHEQLGPPKTSRIIDVHQNLLTLLQSGKCDLTITNKKGNTALEIARSNGCARNAAAIRAAMDGKFYDEYTIEPPAEN